MLEQLSAQLHITHGVYKSMHLASHRQKLHWHGRKLRDARPGNAGGSECSAAEAQQSTALRTYAFAVVYDLLDIVLCQAVAHS